MNFLLLLYNELITAAAAAVKEKDESVLPL